MAEFLAGTESDGAGDRIEVRTLPRDRALCERHAVVFSGPHAAELLQMVIDAFDAYFTEIIAAQPALQDPHGPDSSA
jgi:hypothetical protein